MPKRLETMNRRDMLHIGVSGTLGLLTSNLLPSVEAARNRTREQCSVLVVFWGGGVSHIDTIHPNDRAPEGMRGEYKSIPTSVPGVRFSETLPDLARVVDKCTLIKGINAANGAHDGAVENILTTTDDHTLGQVLGGSNEVIPSTLLDVKGCWNPEPGIRKGVGIRIDYQQKLEEFEISSARATDVTRARGRMRRNLLSQLEQARPFTGSRSLANDYDRQRQLAFDLLLPHLSTAGGEEGQIRRDFLHAFTFEPRELDRYGGDNKRAKQILLAKQLAEAGIPFVTAYDPGDPVDGEPNGAWDSHSNMYDYLKDELAPAQKAVATLLHDVATNQVRRPIVVVLVTEFGRTPKLNDQQGRDHHLPGGWSMVTGGGFKQGYQHNNWDPTGDRLIRGKIIPHKEFADTCIEAAGRGEELTRKKIVNDLLR